MHQKMHISTGLFTLSESEVADAVAFAQSRRLPFDRPYLELAFGNFELSYAVADHKLSFLSLMIGLEALLNPSSQELRHRLSRNGAVLLGHDLEESRKIYSDLKRLYDKRSTLVHVGDEKIDRNDILQLRHYLRDSIKKVSEFAEGKDQLIERLNLLGFGQGHELTGNVASSGRQ
jgi:hypothetical protein